MNLHEDSADARSQALVESQQLEAVHLHSKMFTHKTLTRDTQSEQDGDDESGWAAAETSVRLSPGGMVPGTRFEIVRWIGEGGVGQVFEAIHVDIQRPVALKVLKPEVGTTLARSAAFLAEARACARVESRFVVRVLDFGVLPDDRPFFAMELLGQDTLHSELDEGLLSLQRTIPILRQICKALAAIHETGLVHRDLKPDNVVLQTEDGRSDTVRIVDFGIAVEPGSKPRVAGTPTYMAPEQIRGRDFDARLDIYSLGCVAYEMLTGAAPFEGSLLEVFEAQANQDPPPVSKRRTGLPIELDEALLRCLKKDAQDRWENVHEFEAALCEVQIAAGFTTPWDDLALPEVDEARRRSLAERMPRPSAAVGRPLARYWWIYACVLTLVIGLVIGVVLRGRSGLETERGKNRGDIVAEDLIDELTDAVRIAASRAYWVYPPSGDAEQHSALDWIAELETIDGALAAAASERALELRTELAQTLTRLGDKYWEQENGRAFAVEYYALAQVFVPDQERAHERSALTTAQLANIIARAERDEFSASELRAGAIMAALADDDGEQLHDRIGELIDDPAFVLSMQTRENLGELADAQVEELRSPIPETGPEPYDETDGGTGVEESGTEGDPEDDPEDDPEVARDSAEAKALVSEARKAVAKGNRAEAKRLFNEAIDYDSRSVDALAGLGELHFDAGEYNKALGYARKASRLRPRNAKLHFLVGDCYLKVLRYANARAEYESAAKLGHPRAAARLEYLDGLTG